MEKLIKALQEIKGLISKEELEKADAKVLKFPKVKAPVVPKKHTNFPKEHYDSDGNLTDAGHEYHESDYKEIGGDGETEKGEGENRRANPGKEKVHLHKNGQWSLAPDKIKPGRENSRKVPKEEK